jgi:uncharacterized protein YndB with AHSA1/START domain
MKRFPRRLAVRWLLVVLATVAGLALVVVVAGALLPEAHTARSYTTINAPPDSVWRALTEVEAFASWRNDVSKVELLAPADGSKAWRETGKHGTITFEQVLADPPRRLIARIADPSLPFGGSWTYDVAPEGRGSRVTITEDGVVHNPVFRFMSRFVFGHHATQEDYLRALGRRFGHVATPARG